MQSPLSEIKDHIHVCLSYELAADKQVMIFSNLLCFYLKMFKNDRHITRALIGRKQCFCQRIKTWKFVADEIVAGFIL